MYLEPLHPRSYLGIDNCTLDKYPDVKPCVIKAIAEEEQKPNSQLWKGEPSAEYQLEERLRRIRFFRKYESAYPLLRKIADRLEICERYNRCCSGGCSECGRLLQRWFVRKSRNVIRDSVDNDGRNLVAITIVPAKPIIGPGNLHTLDIGNLQRRLKYALDKSGIEIAIGAIDFSFNEDKRGKYGPFWSAHYYLITSVANEARVKKILKRFFPAERRIPRPVKMPPFNNSRRRRSYAFKIQFKRRIGIITVKKEKDGTNRKCRDTSRDKLRAAERLELFIYLDRIGFADRFIFRSVKPIIRSTRVKLKAIDG
jgi:hypothetical protein